MPTHERPDLLARALQSVVSAPRVLHRTAELVVSDNSTDERSEAVHQQAAAIWGGSARYIRHTENGGMVDNFNHCVELAQGEYVLILHDDDYLLCGGLEALVRAASEGAHPVLLFGVRIVNQRGRLLRRQTFRSDRYLPPQEAVRRLLSRSSFVRFPAILVRRQAFADVGRFDPSLHGTTDLDMWLRLFARFGVACCAETTAAYVVHSSAATNGVFNAATVAAVMRIFREAASNGLLDSETLGRCQTAWFHQFILGGALRHLRRADRAGAREVLALFQLPEVRALGVSPRWAPLRAAFNAATVGASGRPRR